VRGRSLSKWPSSSFSLHCVIVTTISASNAARCVACHGGRSHAVPVALVGECSIPLRCETPSENNHLVDWRYRFTGSATVVPLIGTTRSVQ